MVTDIGGLGDKSFNDLSYAGLERAKKELGVEIKAVSSKAMTDYDSNIAQLGNAKYDVIFCVGFLMSDAISKAATAFPDVDFGGIDIYNAGTQPNQLGQGHRGRSPDQQGKRDRLRRRHADPAGPEVRGRLHRGRQVGQP
jgi:basic membrane lipoprotein Med (substrate-binding protein (PBP1-ABC) superfamily)